MSQDIFDSIDPAISGTDLATLLNDFKDAIVSGLSGTTRPTELDIGGFWVDTTNDPTSWAFRIWTGTDDVEVFTIDLSTGVASVALAVDSFIVKKISADTVGAILEFVKRRVASNGQILDGDVVGEIRMVGRTDTATNPVVAKIIWTATDDMTTSAYGGTLSFQSTPEGTATLTEHMRFIDGILETVVAHKLNSQILVSQNVATAATIAQLSAAKVVVEMTGATATEIQGLNASHASKVVTIHNRSTANVTLAHLDSGAAAADRIELPGATDFILTPESSATLFYCTTDTYWKLLSTSDKISGFNVDTLYGLTQSWTAPATINSVRVRAHRPLRGVNTERSSLLDVYGNAYSWGLNANGQSGVGSVTPASSPVAVLGGLQFEKIYGAATGGSYGINHIGAAYAWGLNTNGQLGDASVIPKSSPVAVAGGLRFVALYPRDASVHAISANGLLYSWGINTNGQLGHGNVTPKSSPVAVLSSLKFSKVVSTSGAAAAGATLGLTTAGVAYAWGINTNGNLGLGDVTPRSSPVAVLGGHTFKDIGGGALSSRYFFVGLNLSGAAYAWGINTSGNLGVGDATPRSSPVAVVGGLTFERIFTHDKSETVFGLTSAGALYAWGDNSQGQLGVGDITNRSSPVAVLGGLTFASVKLFQSTVIGLTSDGTAYAWGLNANGQLGLGDVVSRSSPVAVLGGLKFIDIQFADGPTDKYSVFGTVANGNLYSWGVNVNGTLGLGDVTPRSSPVAVLGAFSPDATKVVRNIDLTVTGGSTYTVTTGPGMNTFGDNPIGRDVSKIEIEYIR